MFKKAFHILFTLFLLSLFSCGTRTASKAVYMRQSGTAQGTTYSIIYESPEGEDYTGEITELLISFEKSLSIYDSTSLISKLNRNEPGLMPDSWFTEVFNKSAEIHKASGGVFDITVAPLVNVWGFGPEKKQKVDQKVIDSLLVFVGMDKVHLKDGQILKADPRVQLDMNAIAQGYSVDLVSRLLEAKGCVNYLVEIGGEIRAKGLNDKHRIWRVGIDRPSDINMTPGMDLEAILELQDRSLATSGNYRKFFVENGVKYSHTIDPSSGFPVQHNLLSVTIVAEDCMTADAWATACMASGLEKSKAILAGHSELGGLLIYSDDQGNYLEYLTPGIEKSLVRE